MYIYAFIKAFFNFNKIKIKIKNSYIIKFIPFKNPKF